MQHSYAGYIHESVLLQQCDKAAQLHSESKQTPVAHAHLFSFDVRNEYSMRRLTFVPLIYLCNLCRQYFAISFHAVGNGEVAPPFSFTFLSNID